MKPIKEMSKQELLDFISPLTNRAKEMILAGVLVKNVIKHFTNGGLTLACAENIVEIGVFKAEKFQKHKAI